MLDKSTGLPSIGIGLLIMFLLNFPCHGQSVIKVSEGQNLTLTCENKVNHHGSRKWIVTSNGQLVSTCKFEECFNSYPDKFWASFKTQMSVYRRHKVEKALVLDVYNVTSDLTRIECGFNQWEVNVVAKSSSLTLTSDHGSEDVFVSAGSHVSLTCKTRSDGLVPGSLILYRDDINNVLNSTSSSDSLTYFLSDLVCGSSFVVGCKGEDLSAVEMEVRVGKCQVTFLDRSIGINEDTASQKEELTFQVNDNGEGFMEYFDGDILLFCQSNKGQSSWLSVYLKLENSIILIDRRFDQHINTSVTLYELQRWEILSFDVKYFLLNLVFGCRLYVDVFDDGEGIYEDRLNEDTESQKEELTFQVNGIDKDFSTYFDGDILLFCQSNKGQSSWLLVYLKFINSVILIDRRYDVHINISVTLYDLQRWEILSYDVKDFFLNLVFGCHLYDDESNATKEIIAQFEYHGKQFDAYTPIVRSSPITNSIGVKVGVSLACILTLLVVILIVIALCRRARARSRKHQQDHPPAYSDIFFVNPSTEPPDYASLPPPYETTAQQH